MAGFKNAEGKLVVERMIAVIHENRVRLSELDGAIGDGDHGINMDKGFTLAEHEMADMQMSMSDALKMLGRTLLMKIGGSVGPLYGSMFKGMAGAAKEAETVDAGVLKEMLTAGRAAVAELGEAKVGDKTLVDTLEPAMIAVSESVAGGADLPATVDSMIAAAEAGWKSTEDLMAKIGRAARLGERSRGALDPGATSCYLLLKAMGEAMKELSV
ncbi:MAG: dihydroxyacetone kinase subunit DhaL [Spirochaetia bacterium]